jgi:predicted transposase YbfD/YdcC
VRPPRREGKSNSHGQRMGKRKSTCAGSSEDRKKSNEITAIPTLLDMLELKGCIVTIDAMGCQKENANLMNQAEADYVFGIQGNQSSLHDDLRLYFETE